MRHVLIRDDDVNGLTPAAHLERLHRPWIERGLPLNLAVIPKVYSDLSMPGGRPEGFLVAREGNPPKAVEIGRNAPLVTFFKANPGIHLALHGYHHSEAEFARDPGLRPYFHWRDVIYRLDSAEALFAQAGLPHPAAFVPPYGALSRESLGELARRYRVISTEEIAFGNVPRKWALHFGLRKLLRRSHWRAGRTRFLADAVGALPPVRGAASFIAHVEQALAAQSLTVIPMRWWDFFPDNRPDERAIGAWHELAGWLAAQRDVNAVSFADVAGGKIPLH